MLIVECDFGASLNHTLLCARPEHTPLRAERKQHALKGQKLLAQGIALGNYGHKPVAL